MCRGHLIASVPPAPILRAGNLLTGRHVAAWGNTPGHLNHWSTASSTRFINTQARIRGVRKPLPWTIV